MKTRRLITALLCAVMTLSAFSCGRAVPAGGMDTSSGDHNVRDKEIKIDAKELSAGVSAGSVEASALDGRFSAALTDFSLDLLKNTAALTEDKAGGVLVSPLSVALALSMTANGARDETLAQMEQLFGDLTIDELNAYFLTYIKAIAASETLKSANSIWFRDDADRFQPNADFLQKNADYYGAQIYASPFDGDALTDVNNWVKKHTDGMIDSILDEIAPDDVMYLMDAIAFDAKWEKVFNKERIYDGSFYAYNGLQREVALMESDERYISDLDCRGFIKDYKGGKYSFAAFLPEDRDVDIYDFVASLDGAKLSGLLDSKKSEDTVEISFPQFTSEFNVSLVDTLKAMGMERAFLPTGELDGIGVSSEGNLYIGDVLHKTYIEVNADGTKAAAATAVLVKDECEPMIMPIYFNRPFVYAIIDGETNIPVFIGVLADITE